MTAPDIHDNRDWTSNKPKLHYSYTPDLREYSGVNVPAPSSLVARFGCRWLFCPHLDSKYVQHLQQNRYKQRSLSKPTGRYAAWYALHISEDLQLKFLAPLSTHQADRITAPLKELMSDPDLQTLRVDSAKLDPLYQSLGSSPLAIDSSAIGGESDLQHAVFPVFKSIVNIVSTLFTRKYIKAPTASPLEVCHTFGTRVKASPNQDTIENVYLLRTSTKPQTSITADYYVYLNFDRAASAVYDHKGTKHVLQDSLLRPGNIVTFAVEFKPELYFKVPTLKIAYPNMICQDSHTSSSNHDAQYHAYNFKVYPEASPEMDDFRADRLGVLDDILGTDQWQDAQGEPPGVNLSPIKPIEQLWAKMVSQGAYVGMLMNWYDRNHICVRDPRTGTLYISKSFNNRFLGGPFGNNATCLDAFIVAMDKKKFPWVNHCNSSSLMFVIGGAILTGFRLLHPNPPSDLFVPESQLNGESWKAAENDLEERRKQRNDEAMMMSQAELSIYLSEYSNNGPVRASDGQGADHGITRSQRDNSTSQSGASIDSNTAGNLQGLGYGGTSHSTLKQGIDSDCTPEKLYLGIFDGDLYRSKTLEVFYNRGSCVPRSNSPNVRNGTMVFLNRFVAEGAVGDVWQGFAALPDEASPVPIAAKLAFTPQAMESLEYEHSIYQYFGNDPDLPVPRMYGYYKNIPDEIGQQVGLLLLSWVEGVMPQCKEEVQNSKSLIIDALRKLHLRGVVHGDLAPRNILIDRGKVILIDFDRAGVHDKSPDVDMNQLKIMIESNWSGDMSM